MTKHEKIVVSAYTGVLMCDFDDLHKYIEKKLGRSVWSHELVLDTVQDEIKEKVKDDFLAICSGTDERDRLICPHCRRTFEEKDVQILNHYVVDDHINPYTSTRHCPHCNKQI